MGTALCQYRSLKTSFILEKSEKANIVTLLKSKSAKTIKIRESIRLLLVHNNQLMDCGCCCCCIEAGLTNYL